MAETRSVAGDTERKREGGIIISPPPCCLPVLSKEEIIYQPFLSAAQRVLVIM